jgi:hypothetical protein
MAENGNKRAFDRTEISVGLEPKQPAPVSAAVAGLLAEEGSDGPAAWWRAGIAAALAGGVTPPESFSAPDQSGVGAAPLRKSRGTDRP